MGYCLQDLTLGRRCAARPAMLSLPAVRHRTLLPHSSPYGLGLGAPELRSRPALSEPRCSFPALRESCLCSLGSGGGCAGPSDTSFGTSCPRLHFTAVPLQARRAPRFPHCPPQQSPFKFKTQLLLFLQPPSKSGWHSAFLELGIDTEERSGEQQLHEEVEE